MMDFPERITIDSHTIEIVPRYAQTDKAGVLLSVKCFAMCCGGGYNGF